MKKGKPNNFLGKGIIYIGIIDVLYKGVHKGVMCYLKQGQPKINCLEHVHVTVMKNMNLKYFHKINIFGSPF